MEPITHFLTGACLGRAGLNRKTALATLTLTLAAEAADIDVLWYFDGSVTGFAHHRGFTHTLLGVPFVAALVLAIVYGIYCLMKRWGRGPQSAPRWKLLYVYALLGGLVHIFLDFTNNYGVRPFAPFYPRWYSWDIVFIVDPLIWLVLILGLAVPGLTALISEEVGARKKQFRGRGGAYFALTCFVLIIFMRDFEHTRAVNALESLTYRDEDPVRVSAFPYALSPFKWNGVVETHDFFESVTVDTLQGVVDPDDSAVVRYKPQETPITLAAKKSRLGRFYLDWAQYPLVEPVHVSETGYAVVEFQDLRFNYVTGIGGRRRGPPLAGYVVLDPKLQVIDEYIGPRRPDPS